MRFFSMIVLPAHQSWARTEGDLPPTISRAYAITDAKKAYVHELRQGTRDQIAVETERGQKITNRFLPAALR